MPRELRNILYVDDETDIQTVVALALEFSGELSVQCCGSGAEALKLIESSPPDLVLLDVMMPALDGPSTLHRIRALPRGDRVPVIFVTAKVQPYEIERFMSLGAIGVVTKPFDPLTLAATIQSMWAKADA